MIDILMVGFQGETGSSLKKRFGTFGDIRVESVDTGDRAMAFISGKRYHLAVVNESLDDMSGLSFIEKLVKIDPMANTALAGGLNPHEFHEATEGLGVLMQLPVEPEDAHVNKLVEHLRRVLKEFDAFI